MTEDVEAIAGKLSQQDRDIALSLCGNAWQGQGSVTPGLKRMNALELIHLDVLISATGNVRRYKARPTELGTSLRAFLASKEQSGG